MNPMPYMSIKRHLIRYQGIMRICWKESRINTGLSQQSFANLLGICVRSIQYYESGKRLSSPRSIKKLLRFLENK